jgi:hypothetical protein
MKTATPDACQSPQVLPLFEEFVQIDFTVLVAFLISNCGMQRGLGISDLELFDMHE